MSNRKLKAFYVTMGVLLAIVETAILKNIPLTGDNIVALSTIAAGIGGAFFGANFGEHWTKTKTPSAS